MTPDRQSDSSSPAQSCLLIYDAECRLCVAAKRKLEEAGGGQAGSNVRFVSYYSPEARAALGDHYRPGRPEMAFLVQPSGDIRQGLDAFLPLAPSLRIGRFVLWLMRLPFAKRPTEGLYRLLARHRYRLFGKVRV